MKEPKDFYNDPQLTAYALGELEGDERAAVEAALKTDAVARAAVDEIRATARQIEAALAAEPETEIVFPPLKAKHIASYATARKLVHFPYWLVGGLAAACFAVVLVLHEQTVARVEWQEKEAMAARQKALDALNLNHVDAVARRMAFKKSAEVTATAEPSTYTEVTFPAPSIPAGRVELQSQPQVVAADKTAVLDGAIAPKQPANGFKAVGDTAVADSSSKPQAVTANEKFVLAEKNVAQQPAEKEAVRLSQFTVSAPQAYDYSASEKRAGSRVTEDIAGVNNSVAYDFPSRTTPDGSSIEADAGHAVRGFLSVAQHPLSTFGLDVGTASYANVRRLLQSGERPPADAVRIEELVNYFPYAYAAPRDHAPLAATLEVAAAPWAPTHRLVRIGLKAREVTAGGKIGPVAKDVQVQVEFNPAKVQSYRLIGYDDRALKKEDFNNEAITAGDVGAGHTVTALYEVVPTGVEPPATPGVDALKYQKTEGERRSAFAEASADKEARGERSEVGDQKTNPELLTVKVRYTPIEGGASQRLEFPLTDRGAVFAEASMDFKFAAAVAGFGMILRDSPHRGSATLAEVEQWAGQGLGLDAGGYRAEFIGLVRQAEKLKE